MANKKDDQKGQQSNKERKGGNQWTQAAEIERVVAELEAEARPILKAREQEFGRRDTSDQKSVLTVEQVMMENRVLYFLTKGMTVDDAATNIGRTRETIWRWRQDPNNLTFATMFSLARKKAKQRAITTIQNAILNGNIPAAQWWLERRGGKEFKEIKKTEVDVNFNQSITVTERKEINGRFAGLLIDEPLKTQGSGQKPTGQAN